MAQKLTDKSLKKYEDQLIALRVRLRGEVEGLVQLVPETINKPGMDSHLPTHLADQDAEGLDTQLALIHNEESILYAVEDALVRLDNGSFGQCTGCGETIAKERLDAIPYTPHCIGCAEAQTQD